MANESELKARAAAIKESWVVRARIPHRRKPCADCGKVVPMCGRTYRCPECQAAHNKVLAKERRPGYLRSVAATREESFRLMFAKHGIDYTPPTLATHCEHCGEPFTSKRITAKFCSDKCRVYAGRRVRRKK